MLSTLSIQSVITKIQNRDLALMVGRQACALHLMLDINGEILTNSRSTYCSITDHLTVIRQILNAL